MNAIVTGATKGIGKAIATKLAESGYNLAICARHEAELNTLSQQLMARYPDIRVISLATDCAQPAQVSSFASFVQQHFGTVDVLINNIGAYFAGGILDEDESAFYNQYQINVNTAYSLCRVFGRQMRESRSGHIINIVSIAALQPVAEAGSYTVTKFALHGLTKVLRMELMPHNVKVTAILPGSTLTSSWDGTDIAAERFIAAGDIAKAVAYCLELSAGANTDDIIITPLSGQI